MDYHWTAALMRQYLEHLAATGLVGQSARHVGMSPRAAYDQRHRHPGFRLGWAAAILLARDVLTDQLIERAILGSETRVTRERIAENCTQITRHRHDARLATHLLTHLDRHAGLDGDDMDVNFARRAADHWGDYLTHVLADDAAPDALPRWLHDHENMDLSCEVARISAVSAHRRARRAADRAAAPLAEADFALWYDDGSQQWMTNLPPVGDWLGTDGGRPGYATYWRTLDCDEAEIIDARTDDAQPLPPEEVAAIHARLFAGDGPRMSRGDDRPIQRLFPADTPPMIFSMIDALIANAVKIGTMREIAPTFPA
ncbi:MAG: hypothetical protein IT553_01435 [Sphingomonadaceae bacterium]|nr:hypothetical protein [Sphingomonadaceae bacterium]